MYTERELQGALTEIAGREQEMITSVEGLLSRPAATPRNRRPGRIALVSASSLAVAAIAVTAAILGHQDAGPKSTGGAGPAAGHPRLGVTQGRSDVSVPSSSSIDQATGCHQPALAPNPSAESTMVPQNPTGVTVCAGGTQTVALAPGASLNQLVTALDALPVEPIQHGCSARHNMYPAQGTYEIHFHYAAAPDVVVNLLPGCVPSVNNTFTLQSEDATTVLPLLAKAAKN